MLRKIAFGILVLGWLPYVSFGQDRIDNDAVRAALEKRFSDLDADDDEQLNEKEFSGFPPSDLEAFRMNGLSSDFPIHRSDFVDAGLAAAIAMAHAAEAEKPKEADTKVAAPAAELTNKIAIIPPALPPARTGSKKNRYVPELPAEYLARDKNGDGQIGLYEWDRKKFAEFAKLDKNGDGFLTPAELVSKETLKAIYSRTPNNGTDPSKLISGGGATSGTAVISTAALSGGAPAGGSATPVAPVSGVNSGATVPVAPPATGDAPGGGESRGGESRGGESRGGESRGRRNR